ncbi:uncharacterized protein LOC130445312 [Diorhabda sublineata]|uniref:uncharacterized protein LOC130445312 n=1 Tax=Diorhabda sublineata TaxID=1163346 RepID=UPI0024E0EE8F|nr:uncharacterized protein LOC130445312 [Diorhabda sublineata]
MKNVHTDLGHIGIKQMQKMISSVYAAENMTKNIKLICEGCIVCLKNKSRGHNKYGLMSHLGPATKPFQICSIDTVGGFGGTRSTKRYLHLLSDHFTRYAYILASSTQNANDFIKLIKNCAESDNIELILSDQCPGINSKEFKRFLDENNIPIIFTAVNSPFSNGLNERLNQTLVNKIRCRMNEHDKKKAWTSVVHSCVQKYNETEHTVTGYAPKSLGCNMSIKVHYLHSHLDRFPDNLGEITEEQGERFHQDIKCMEDRYQGRWDTHIWEITAGL